MIRPEGIAAIIPENYRFLQEVIYQGSGIVVDRDKDYLFEARLSPVVRQHGLSSINELCSLLRAPEGSLIRPQVVEVMTTNETYFFREPAQYNAIRHVLAPELRERRAGPMRKATFWSAASSTGQEAYSLAMLLAELGFSAAETQILGTDLSNQVLEKARNGRYLQLEVNRGLPASYAVKYFRRQGLEWELKEEIRQLVKFERMDLRHSMHTLGPFDAVFCRNVLIYFDASTRRQIVREIHRTLFRGGWLLLGGSESALGIEEYFERRSIGSATVYVAR